LHGQFGNRLRTRHLTEEAIESSVVEADLIIGAILVPGATTPHLLRREQLGKLRPGAVLVDVSIDQGGCFETSHPTTHADPTFIVDGIVHYCVANMPGAVARTSTFALNNATLPFTLALADKGCRRALLDDPHLRNGLNIHQGKITYGAVAEVRGLTWTPAEKALENGA
jgi:alanine dehydrogenase